MLKSTSSGRSNPRGLQYGWTLCILCILCTFSARLVRASERPQIETVKGISEAHLVTPESNPSPAPQDPRVGIAYPYLCRVEIAENGIYLPRFVIHVQEREHLPLARRAGRMYALLWGTSNRRFGTLASRLRKPPVEVWLSRSGEAGGEQFSNNIYLYDVLSERSDIEWAREFAHEYGHYLLPGASGYTSPENWSNGVLGERMFLKWLLEDVVSGRIKEEDLPSLRQSELEDYSQKQVVPLIERIQASGPNSTLLVGTERKAMDEFTALLLFADTVYGSPSLMNLLEFLPTDGSHTAAGARGPDFLTAFQTSISARESFTTLLTGDGEMMVYLPAGVYSVRPADKSELTQEAKLTVRSMGQAGKSTPVQRTSKGWVVRLSSPGWRKVALAAKTVINLLWEKGQA